MTATVFKSLTASMLKYVMYLLRELYRIWKISKYNPYYKKNFAFIAKFIINLAKFCWIPNPPDEVNTDNFSA
jgi:hypothetical protein